MPTVRWAQHAVFIYIHSMPQLRLCHNPLLRLLVPLREAINCMLIFCMLITANNSYINILVCLHVCVRVWVAVGVLSLLFNILTLVRTRRCVSPFQQLKVWNLTLNANVRCVYCKMCAANCKITVLNATIVLSAFFRADTLTHRMYVCIEFYVSGAWDALTYIRMYVCICKHVNSTEIIISVLRRCVGN